MSCRSIDTKRVYREYRAYVYGDVRRTGSRLAGADTMGQEAGVFIGSIALVDSVPYVDGVTYVDG